MSIHMFKTLGENNVVTEWDVTFENRVLYDGERNGYDDSDFYAVVWDEHSGQMITTVYATTRGWTYPNHCEIDFTPESDPEGWDNMLAVLRPRFLELAKNNLLERASYPEIGDKVLIIHGPYDGTHGELIWRGKGRGGRGAERVGISPSGNKVNAKYPDVIWTWETNIAKYDVFLSPEDEERLIIMSTDERIVNWAISEARCAGSGSYFVV